MGWQVTQIAEGFCLPKCRPKGGINCLVLWRILPRIVFIRGRTAYRRAGALSPLRLIACHDLERHNHLCRSKWSKVLNAVTQFTPNIPEYPSALQLVEIMENGKHAVMAQYLLYHVEVEEGRAPRMSQTRRKLQLSRLQHCPREPQDSAR